jgi:hypothetical protein
MPQPQTVEGTLGNLDMDICKDKSLGKAFYTIWYKCMHRQTFGPRIMSS